MERESSYHCCCGHDYDSAGRDLLLFPMESIVRDWALVSSGRGREWGVVQRDQVLVLETPWTYWLALDN